MYVYLSVIPENWFLSCLKDERSQIRYVSDRHEHRQWRAELQRVTGGRLCVGIASTPQAALEDAVRVMNESILEGRWMPLEEIEQAHRKKGALHGPDQVSLQARRQRKD